VTTERWREIQKIFAEALEKKASERVSYLNEACADASLREQVELMIVAHEQGDSDFLEPLTARSSEELKSGDKIGPYEVLALIGAGGMGEVYKARDTKLRRDVALKVLPDVFARDVDRMARFQREAKVLASLNHPNIATIYGLEESDNVHALAMELIDGPTLADRIRRGPIPLDEALPLATQMAEALEYAHEHGIVHRDLKPANVKLTADDAVKILDFGLAKAMESGFSTTDIAKSPTINQMATETGVLLGTAAYMAPEQAKGKSVDRRADIWAFGCVLYEMLTGKKAFRGDTVTDVLATVIKNEPDWSSLPAATPMRVRVLLQRCLQKDPQKRLRDVGEARISLEDVLSGAPDPLPSGAAPIPMPLWRRSLPWAVALIAVLSLALVRFHTKVKALPRPVERFDIRGPGPNPTGVAGWSPDGTRLLLYDYGSGANPTTRLWLRRMDSTEAQLIAGTEGAGGYPFWSPDGRFIVFTQDGKLKKLDTQGGPPQVLCDVGAVLGGFWTPDGKIVFSEPTRPPGLWDISADGGTPTPLPGFKHSGSLPTFLFPKLLQDGRHFLYASGDNLSSADVYLGTLDSKSGKRRSKKVLTGVDANFAYAPSRDDPNLGYALFLRGASVGTPAGTLIAQPLDLRKLALTGDPVPIAQWVSRQDFSASRTGILAYGSSAVVGGNAVSGGGTVAGEIGQLTLFDRQGKTLGTVGTPAAYESLAFSPDGKRVAEARVASQSSDQNIWITDLARGVSTRFTFDSGVDRFPVWSPDGKRIIFDSNRDGTQELYEKLSNGGGDAKLLFKFRDGILPVAWSGDGRFLLFGGPVDTPQESDMFLSVLALDSNGHLAGKPFRFALKGRGFDDRFSPGPQGRRVWVAYSSRKSGKNEIYVQPFDPKSPTGTPPGGENWQVSTNGGYSPRWNANGKELFYVAPDGTVMSAAVSSTTGFHSGIPKPLFKPKGLLPKSLYFVWDASSDGKKFIFPIMQAASNTGGSTRLAVVLNWPSLLKK
jgi:serine/threonine protein kinase